jgi:hypothetical protein
VSGFLQVDEWATQEPLHADAPKEGPQQPSIIDVCAAHLVGRDLAREKGLMLVPFVNGAPCGLQPDHGKGIKALFRKKVVDLVATVEAKFPDDVGLVKVSISNKLVRVPFALARSL